MSYKHSFIAEYVVNPSPLEWIVINLLTIYLTCYAFPLKNSLQHKMLFKLKANSNSKSGKLVKYAGIAVFFGGLIGIWRNFEGFYQLPFFFELENENLKALWSLQISVFSMIMGIFLLLFSVANFIVVCEEGIYIQATYNFFYKKFIKREDLEIFEEKKEFLKEFQTCFIIKVKNKMLLELYESIYKKEDLEKLKIWYENKL